MVIGIDIGATHIRAIKYGNKTLTGDMTKTPRSLKSFKKNLISLIKNLDSKNISGIGLGVAGKLSPEKIIYSGNIKFLNGFALPGFIRENFKVKVLMDNDTRCFMRAELILGQAKGHKSAIGITLGSGLGGSLVWNGQIIPGAHYTAGEIGSTGFRDSELEDYASAKFLNKHGYDFKRLAENLADGLTSAVHLFDPECIILGGGIMQNPKGGPVIKKVCAQKLRQNLRGRPAANVKVKTSRLGDFAGSLGAALLIDPKLGKAGPKQVRFPKLHLK